MKDAKTIAKEIEAEFDSVLKAIEETERRTPVFPEGPQRPRLAQKHTSNEALEYSHALSVYENEFEAYKRLEKDHLEIVAEIYEGLEIYIKDQAGLNTIPEQYREKVWSRAWQEGHSGGRYEVYLNLVELVNIFE